MEILTPKNKPLQLPLQVIEMAQDRRWGRESESQPGHCTCLFQPYCGPIRYRTSQIFIPGYEQERLVGEARNRKQLRFESERVPDSNTSAGLARRCLSEAVATHTDAGQKRQHQRREPQVGSDRCSELGR